MHLAKGLEFRAVARNGEVVPLQEQIESGVREDNAEIEEVYDTQRHLLHCTRGHWRGASIRVPRQLRNLRTKPNPKAATVRRSGAQQPIQFRTRGYLLAT